MKKLLKVSVASVASFSLAFSVFAQSPSPTPNREDMMKNAKMEMEQMRESAKQNMESQREAAKQKMEALRENMKQQMEQEREALKQQMENAREELKNKIETKREQLKTDLKKIKDERKKQVTERVDKNLDALNEKMTDHFIDVLDHLGDILVKINERTDRASKSVDISPVITAIASASKSIADARAAVQAQAGKTYKITVTTETGLKDAVKKAREALHTDLVALREKVKAAQNAVHDAARAYAKAHGRDIEGLKDKEDHHSPTPTPTLTATPTPTP